MTQVVSAVTRVVSAVTRVVSAVKDEFLENEGWMYKDSEVYPLSS